MYGANGAVSVLFGLWLFAAPGEGAQAVIWLIGSYAMLRGLLAILVGFRPRGLHQRLELRGTSPA